MLSYADDHPHAGTYVVAVARLPSTAKKYFSTATYAIVFQGSGTTLQWKFPAGSDACALARAQNFVDMFRSGLMNPDSPPEAWTRPLYLPAGEVAITSVPALARGRH